MGDLVISKYFWVLYCAAFATGLFVAAYLFGWKYMVQEKRCTEKTMGTVIRYSFMRHGIDGNSTSLPIVKYKVDGNIYQVRGPEYAWYVSTRNTFSKKIATEHKHTKDPSEQVYRQDVKYNPVIGVVKNPMTEHFPIGSQVEVFYDPKNPKLAYVLRYANLKWMFWLFFGSGILCLIIAVFIFFTVM